MGQVTRPPSIEGYIAELEERVSNMERLLPPVAAKGGAEATFAGGTPLATIKAIPHGLAAAPAIILATVQTAGQGIVFTAHAGNETAALIQIQIEAIGFNPGAGAKILVGWVAYA